MAGIEDPSVIDVITRDEQADEYVLIMIASRPWTDSEKQLNQLLSKVNTYLVFALDEGLLARFPDAAGKAIRLQLDCVAPPTKAVQELLDLVRPKLDEHALGLRVNILS